MIEADKTRMLAALLQGIPRGSVIYRQLEKHCSAELETIEPIFDEILLRELTSLAKFIIVYMLQGGARR